MDLLSMKWITVSQARAQLASLVGRLQPTVISRNGKPAAVLMSVDEYRALRALGKLARHPEMLVQALGDHEKVQRGDLDGFATLPGV